MLCTPDLECLLVGKVILPFLLDSVLLREKHVQDLHHFLAKTGQCEMGIVIHDLLQNISIVL